MLKIKTTTGVFFGLVVASTGFAQADPPASKLSVSIVDLPATAKLGATDAQASMVQAPAIRLSQLPTAQEGAGPAPLVPSSAAPAPVVPSTVPAPSSSALVPHRPNGEPGWVHGVIRTGEDREAIKSLPMTERPYRPLHFYGNTVRRMHYRGTAIPAPRDVVGAGAATILRK